MKSLLMALVISIVSSAAFAAKVSNSVKSQKLNFSAVIFARGDQACVLDVSNPNLKLPDFVKARQNFSSEQTLLSQQGLPFCKDEISIANEMSSQSYVLNGAQSAFLPLGAMGIACVISGIHGALTSNKSKSNPVLSQGAGVVFGMVGAATTSTLGGLYFPRSFVGGIVGLTSIWMAALVCHASGNTIVYLVSSELGTSEPITVGANDSGFVHPSTDPLFMDGLEIR